MGLKDFINQKYLEDKVLLNLKFKFLENKPFEHLSLNEFLKPEVCEELFLSLKDEEYYLEENDLYQFFRTFDFKNSMNQVILKFRDFLKSEEFISFIEVVVGEEIMRTHLDLHSLKLKNSNYLLCHDDMVQGRAFAFIFNLSKNWKKEDGGSLDLFESDNLGEVTSKIGKTVVPNFGQFNIFKVQKTSYHQISEVVNEKERLSIGGWFYGKGN